MAKYKKFIVPALAVVFVGVLIATPAFGVGSSFQRFFKRSGNNVTFLGSAWELGSSASRIAKGWFTNLDASTIVIGGATTGDLTLSSAATSTANFTAYGGADTLSGNINYIVGDPRTATSTATVLTLEANGSNWETGTRVLKIVTDDTQAIPLAINNGSGDVAYFQRTGQLFTSGGITLTSGGTITSTAAGNVTISPQGNGAVILGQTGGTGYTRTGWGSTSHSLASSSDLLVTGKLEVDSTAYFDNGVLFYNTLLLTDGVGLFLGTGSDSVIGYRTGQTNDAVVWGLSSDSNSILFTEKSDISFDFAHAQQTNPTLFIHSANTSTNEWISFTHDKTNGIIDVGTGTIRLNDNTQLGDNIDLFFGSGGDVAFRYSSTQTADALLAGLSADSRSLLIVEATDRSFDFAHAQQTNPTLFIHSANQATDEWISFTHDQTDAVITSGTSSTKFLSGSTTSTVEIGVTGQPGCLAIQDTDGAGFTYCSTLDGTMTCGTTSCK